MQVRFRDEEHYAAVRGAAEGEGVSANEYVLRAVDQRMGSEVTITKSFPVKMTKEALEVATKKAPRKGRKASPPEAELKTLPEIPDEAIEALESAHLDALVSTSPIADAIGIRKPKREHDVKTCTMYRCGQCKVAGVKNPNRGL